MSRAEALDAPAKAPRGFSLKTYIEEERFAYPVGEERIRLVAAFDEKTAGHLCEPPVLGNCYDLERNIRAGHRAARSSHR